MDAEMRQALDERADLIETRADAVLDTAIEDNQPWSAALGPIPQDPRAQRLWRQNAKVVAAYRDRYGVTAHHPIGPEPDSAAQRIDAARAKTALARAQRLTTAASDRPSRPAPGRTPGRTL